jgi:hypothetical protein
MSGFPYLPEAALNSIGRAIKVLDFDAASKPQTVRAPTTAFEFGRGGAGCQIQPPSQSGVRQ